VDSVPEMWKKEENYTENISLPERKMEQFSTNTQALPLLLLEFIII
jgi:hypothetical protein